MLELTNYRTHLCHSWMLDGLVDGYSGWVHLGAGWMDAGWIGAG